MISPLRQLLSTIASARLDRYRSLFLPLLAGLGLAARHRRVAEIVVARDERQLDPRRPDRRTRREVHRPSTDIPIKDIWPYPLRKDFASLLCR